MIIQNVISTANLCCNLDLQKIAEKGCNVEYKPHRFPAVIMRIRDPYTTALIFSNGKMVCTGAKSVEHSNIAARKFARKIQKLGFDVKFTKFRIRNIVGSCTLGFSVQLEKLADMTFANFVPEFFPGLNFKCKNATVLVFASGKVIITGTKSKQEIDNVFELIYSLLYSCRI